jgi:hypothetical protein
MCGFLGVMLTEAVFEDESFADKATMAVEKTIHHGGDVMDENVGEVGTEKGATTIEEIQPKKSAV